RDGLDLTIVAEGRCVRAAVEASDVLRGEGISARVLNMHTIKPIDLASLKKAIHETKFILAVEEHSVIGGLGSAVAEVIAELGDGKLLRLGIPDRFTTEVSSHASMLARYGLHASGIQQAAIRLVGKR